MVLKLFILAVCLGLCLGIYGILIEPFQLKIKEWTVTTDKWKNQSDLKIAILTDIHAGYPWMSPKRITGIVGKANQLNPDIILLLGDYVATHPFKKAVSADEGLEPLKKLRAKCGVYAVLGNHDFDPRIQGWREAFLETGIPLLEDDVQKITCHDKEFWLAGLKDQYYQEPNLAKTLAKTTNDFPVLVMMHEPDLFPEIPTSVALSFAGHTHGGQVRLPFIGAVLVPSKYGTRYAYGHIREDGKDFIVSGGLGNSIIPVRFLMPPEITLVHLKAPQ